MENSKSQPGFKAQWGEKTMAGAKAYRLKGVLSFSRREHRFGPFKMEHGTLYYVIGGKVYFKLGNAGPAGCASANQFFWVPPHTIRTFWTDATGVQQYALLLDETETYSQQPLLLQLPEQATICQPQNPAYCQTLFRTAEECWLHDGVVDRVEVHGLALLLISQWLKSQSNDGLAPHLNQIIRGCLGHVAQNYHRPNLKIDELCQLTPWSRRYFFRAFQKVTGLTPQSYIQHIRLNRALDLLAIGELSVREVAQQCGYEDPAYFSRCFTRQVGLPPSEYIRKHKSGERQ